MGEGGDKVLVLGATSLVGRFLVPRLGLRALAVSRRPPADDASGAAWVAADLAAGAGLPRAASVVALTPIWLLPPLMPRLIAGGMTRLVAMSSTSRFTKARSADAGERATAAALAGAEDAVIAACEAAGVAWTLLRPTLIYAEGQDRNVSRLAGLIRRFGLLPLAGAGEGLRQPVHADDLAVAVTAALERPQSAGKAYETPGGETLSYRAMVERIFEGLGRPPRILTIPAPLWRLGLALASPWLKGATAQMGTRMAEDLTFDPEPARRDLGWAPRNFRPRF